MQLHLDFSVSPRHELERQMERAIAPGATVLLDRAEDREALAVSPILRATVPHPQPAGQALT
jgi:hypothetical protein